MSTEVDDTKREAVGDDPPTSEPPAATIPAADVAQAHLKGLIEALLSTAKLDAEPLVRFLLGARGEVSHGT